MLSNETRKEGPGENKAKKENLENEHATINQIYGQQQAGLTMKQSKYHQTTDETVTLKSRTFKALPRARTTHGADLQWKKRKKNKAEVNLCNRRKERILDKTKLLTSISRKEM
jgi:hypothetical protein